MSAINTAIAIADMYKSLEAQGYISNLSYEIKETPTSISSMGGGQYLLTPASTSVDFYFTPKPAIERINLVSVITREGLTSELIS